MTWSDRERGKGVKLSKKAMLRIYPVRPMADNENIGVRWDHKNKCVSISVGGQEYDSTYLYRVELTAGELRHIFLRSLQNPTDAEGKFWKALFSVWEKGTA